MDDTIARMPDAPYSHITVTVRTAQGVSPGALVIALAVGHRGNDLDRALDATFDLGQGLLNHVLDLGKRPGGLHPVIADPLEAFGECMLHHTADKRLDVDPFLFDPLAFMRTVVIRDTVAIIAVDPPKRDRWTHHIFGSISSQTLIPCGDIAFLHVGDKSRTIPRVTGIDQALHLLGLYRLPEHREEMPLPLLAQQGIRHIVEMDPLLRLPIPAATRRDDMQMRVVLPIASMGLDDDDIAALELCAADPAKDII
jgi:hypothetical protein